jgi:hypothetical protein
MSLTNALYSATYNPEAQKALAAQEANNVKAQNDLQETLTEVKAERISAGEMTTNANKQLDSLIAAAEKAATTTSNQDKDFVAAQNILATGAKQTFNQQQQYSILDKFVTLFPQQIKVWDANKLMTPQAITDLTEYVKKVQPFHKSADTKTTAEEIQAKLAVIQGDVQKILQGTKVPPNALKLNLDKKTLDDQLKAVNATADQTFDSGKLLSDIMGNTTSFVLYFFYFTICLLAGMLAANDAIGREVKYRVLFFIYGFIFAPFILIYYLVRLGLGTAPKLYTMLPITQTKGETSLGSFFLFPFYYKEDVVARKKLVDFMTDCATLVGKTFDPSTLPPLPGATTSLTQNIAASIGRSLPNLSTLRVRQGDFFPSIKAVQLQSLSEV